MASGFGLNGGPSRCFPFWQEVLACYVVNTSDTDTSGRAKCQPALEDYYECLHHRKEKARVTAMQAAFRKAEKAHARDAAPSAGEIRGLGLLDKDAEDESKKAKPFPSYK